jgi:hypothetical protein
MTAPVYCEQCEQMTHPTFPHSCFSAAKLRSHKDAEQAVIAAAKAYADTPRTWPPRARQIVDAVAALRAVEGDV